MHIGARPPRGFAALSPERRRAIAAEGGRARRSGGAPYTITRENAKAYARRRWDLAGSIGELSLGRRLGVALQRVSIAELARRSTLARSTIRDAIGGRRITKATAQKLDRALDALEGGTT
jgi:hypothetical protein